MILEQNKLVRKDWHISIVKIFTSLLLLIYGCNNTENNFIKKIDEIELLITSPSETCVYDIFFTKGKENKILYKYHPRGSNSLIKTRDKFQVLDILDSKKLDEIFVYLEHNINRVYYNSDYIYDEWHYQLFVNNVIQIDTYEKKGLIQFLYDLTIKYSAILIDDNCF